MIISNVYEAKAKLSSLINAALAGEEVYISKSNKPKVKLIAIDEPLEERKPGALKGKIKIKPGFDKIPEEFLPYIKN